MAKHVGRFFQIPIPGFRPYVVFGPEANRKVLVTERDKVLWRNTDPVTELLRRGVRCRIMLVEPRLVSGGTVRGEELARLSSPYAVDNLEGMAATRGPRGETLLWLMSDDNFNPLQRNMLLLFELTAPGP